MLGCVTQWYLYLWALMVRVTIVARQEQVTMAWCMWHTEALVWPGQRSSGICSHSEKREQCLALITMTIIARSDEMQEMQPRYSNETAAASITGLIGTCYK